MNGFGGEWRGGLGLVWGWKDWFVDGKVQGKNSGVGGSDSERGWDLEDKNAVGWRERGVVSQEDTMDLHCQTRDELSINDEDRLCVKMRKNLNIDSQKERLVLQSDHPWRTITKSSWLRFAVRFVMNYDLVPIFRTKPPNDRSRSFKKIILWLKEIRNSSLSLWCDLHLDRCLAGLI